MCWAVIPSPSLTFYQSLIMAESAVAEAPAANEHESNKPVFQRTRQGVVVSVFQNEKDGRPWHSINSRKRYKINADEWQTSTSFTYSETVVKQQLEREALTYIDEAESAS